MVDLGHELVEEDVFSVLFEHDGSVVFKDELHKTHLDDGERHWDKEYNIDE